MTDPAPTPRIPKPGRGLSWKLVIGLVLLLAAISFAVLAFVGGFQPRGGAKEMLARLGVSILEAPWEAKRDWRAARPLGVARTEAPRLVYRGGLYLFGGRSHAEGAAKILTAIERYDPTAKTWEEVGQLPAAISYVRPLAVEDRIWLAGGFVGDGKGEASDRVLVWDPRADSWNEGPALPQPVAGGALAQVGTKLHFIGGYAADRQTALDVHWTLDLTQPDAWQEAAPMPAPRGHGALVHLGARLYYIGGQTGHDAPPLDDHPEVFVYETGPGDWRRAAPLPAPRSHHQHATAVHDGRILVVGGIDKSRPPLLRQRGMATLFVYDPEQDSWTTEGHLPEGRTGASAGVIDGILIVTGGSDFGNNSDRAETWTLDLVK